MDRRKVIICDDDEGILEMMALVLRDEQTEVLTEHNSLNVQRLINDQHPDLLVLDLWMPVLSGDQILKQLREQETTIRLPVLVISASRDGKQIAMDHGASDYLAKPFDLDELHTRIENLINK
ncbi:MAG: response regulator [Mucilaginibacter sp.]